MAETTLRYERDNHEGGLLAVWKHNIQEYIIKPLEAAASKTALKAYLTTALVSVAAFTFLILAIFAYILFYWSFIPTVGFQRPIHLQFDNNFETSPASQNSLGTIAEHPYGYVEITSYIVSNQKYDVVIELTLPRTPENLEAGNFMLDVALRGPEKKQKVASDMAGAIRDGVVRGEADDNVVLAHSRRPAILSFRSRLVDRVNKIKELPRHVIRKRRETELLKVSMFEGVSFAKGWRNLPSSLRLEIHSVRRMQIYDAKVSFRAHFTGLRWFMYKWPMTATLVFVSWFWMTEMLFAGIAWAAIMYSEDGTKKLKQEDSTVTIKKEKEYDEGEKQSLSMSDTERTFPTLSGQAPLHYRSPDVKQEEMPTPIQAPPIAGLEADDEDEDADFFVDSGLGTGLESGPARSSSMRKRTGRMDLSDR